MMCVLGLAGSYQKPAPENGVMCCQVTGTPSRPLHRVARAADQADGGPPRWQIRLRVVDAVLVRRKPLARAAAKQRLGQQVAGGRTLHRVAAAFADVGVIGRVRPLAAARGCARPALRLAAVAWRGILRRRVDVVGVAAASLGAALEQVLGAHALGAVAGARAVSPGVGVRPLSLANQGDDAAALPQVPSTLARA